MFNPTNRSGNRQVALILLMIAIAVSTMVVGSLSAADARERGRDRDGQSASQRLSDQARRAQNAVNQRRNAGSTSSTTAAPGASSDSDDDNDSDGGDNNQNNNANQNNAPPTTVAPIDDDDILGNNCDNSNLQPHDGFQEGSRCVGIEMGEVGDAEDNPQLLIVDAPNNVGVNQAFTISVSTRNLVRDRFLAAAAGGYYKESSFLNRQGLQRGHFHTACRILESQNVAPNPEPVPAFFKATEDGQGGRAPDTVDVAVTGIPTAGTAQCAVWAGDGSHRLPMMERANQTPAFDVVRIQVGGRNNNNDDDNNN